MRGNKFSEKQVCVVIPIYKEYLNKYEIISILQCIKVLSKYDIHFVCPENLNTQLYRSKFPQIKNFMFFDAKYFNSIHGYNRLMLSTCFYKKFSEYDYMLIHQTDCYIIKDELLLWVNKGYDYIGGVWFDNYRSSPYRDAKEWFPGNGGLSLRNVKTTIKLLSSKYPVKNIKQLKEEEKERQQNKQGSQKKRNLFYFLGKQFLLFFRLTGYKNNFNYLSKVHHANEDVFFMEASTLYNKISIPNVKNAMFFSWDCHPEFLYKKYKRLPFGCHAWYRNETPYEGNNLFWTGILDIFKKYPV